MFTHGEDSGGRRSDHSASCLSADNAPFSSTGRRQHGITREQQRGQLGVRSTRWRAEAALAVLLLVVMLVVSGAALWFMFRKPLHAALVANSRGGGDRAKLRIDDAEPHLFAGRT